MARVPIEKKIEVKIFQTIQKNMAAMGFKPNQQQNHHRQVNSGQIVWVIKCFLDISILAVYVFCKANRIEEYMDSVFSLTVVAGVTVAFVSIILHNDKLFNMIDRTEMELTFSKCLSVSTFS